MVKRKNSRELMTSEASAARCIAIKPHKQMLTMRACNVAPRMGVNTNVF